MLTFIYRLFSNFINYASFYTTSSFFFHCNLLFFRIIILLKCSAMKMRIMIGFLRGPNFAIRSAFLSTQIKLTSWSTFKINGLHYLALALHQRTFTHYGLWLDYCLTRINSKCILHFGFTLAMWICGSNLVLIGLLKLVVGIIINSLTDHFPKAERIWIEIFKQNRLPPSSRVLSDTML